MGTREQKDEALMWEQDGVIECPHCGKPVLPGDDYD